MPAAGYGFLVTDLLTNEAWLGNLEFQRDRLMRSLSRWWYKYMLYLKGFWIQGCYGSVLRWIPKMARDNNLIRRGAVYYARAHVPIDLVAALGGKEQIWRSLRTAEYAEAKRRKIALVDEWSATFDDMRRRRELTNDDIATAVWDHYTVALDAGDRERATRPTKVEIGAARHQAAADALSGTELPLSDIAIINAMTDVNILAGRAGWAAQRRSARLSRMRSDLASGDTRLIEPDADAFIAKNSFQIERGGAHYRDLCHKLMRAEIEQLLRYAERDRGDFTGRPADPIVAEPANAPEPLDAAGDTIMALFEKYEKENPNNIRPESFKQARRDVQHFAGFVGPRVRASKIDKRQIREWKELLAGYPVKATETTIFKGLSLSEIVARNSILAKPKPTLSRQTIRRYMASLGGFCRWLVKHDYLDVNPVLDMLPKKAPPTTKRRTFTDNHLQTLFTSPLFATCRGEEWREVVKPGNVAVRDHRYWLPLIMLYSGARPGEIAQLRVADVRQEHGIWIMHITEEGDGGKRIKTKGSMRVVPVLVNRSSLGFSRGIDDTAANQFCRDQGAFALSNR